MPLSIRTPKSNFRKNYKKLNGNTLIWCKNIVYLGSKQFFTT